MKKIIAIALAVVMLAALAVPAFAADPKVDYYDATTAKDGFSNTTVVKYGVDQTYTITLPSSVDFGTATSTNAKITATNVVIAGNLELVVTVASSETTGDNEAWTLDCAVSDSVAYGLYKDETTVYDANTKLANGADVLTVKSNAPELKGESTIYFATAGTSQAGTYTDTLTFTITLNEVAQQGT